MSESELRVGDAVYLYDMYEDEWRYGVVLGRTDFFHVWDQRHWHWVRLAVTRQPRVTLAEKMDRALQAVLVAVTPVIAEKGASDG